jgi:hypothetical protein
MYEGDSMLSSLDSYQSDAEKSILGIRKSHFDDNHSTHSRNSSLDGTTSKPQVGMMKKMTKLSQVKAN